MTPEAPRWSNGQQPDDPRSQNETALAKAEGCFAGPLLDRRSPRAKPSVFTAVPGRPSIFVTSETPPETRATAISSSTSRHGHPADRPEPIHSRSETFTRRCAKASSPAMFGSEQVRGSVPATFRGALLTPGEGQPAVLLAVFRCHTPASPHHGARRAHLPAQSFWAARRRRPGHGRSRRRRPHPSVCDAGQLHGEHQPRGGDVDGRWARRPKASQGICCFDIG